jgi:hypothetical protein
MADEFLKDSAAISSSDLAAHDAGAPEPADAGSSGLLDKEKDLASTAGEKLSEVASTVGDALAPAAQTVGAVAGNVGQAAAGTAQTVAGTVADAVGTAAQKVGEGVSNLLPGNQDAVHSGGVPESGASARADNVQNLPGQSSAGREIM